MRLSKTTLILAAFIVISACFMRQVLDFISGLIGRGGVINALWVILALLALLVFIQAIRRHALKPKISVLIIIFTLAFLSSAQLKIAAERLHLIKYGLLGWFVLRDIWRSGRIFSGILFSFMFCLLVASIDEAFQYFLPYRVGELRDVGLAAIGGILGMGVFLADRPSL